MRINRNRWTPPSANVVVRVMRHDGQTQTAVSTPPGSTATVPNRDDDGNDDADTDSDERSTAQ
jgi:hypothetical protein